VTDTATWVAVPQVKYKLGAATTTFTYKKPKWSLTTCDTDIAWPAEYTIKEPDTIKDIVSTATVGDVTTVTITQSGLSSYIGTHSLTVTPK